MLKPLFPGLMPIAPCEFVLLITKSPADQTSTATAGMKRAGIAFAFDENVLPVPPVPSVLTGGMCRMTILPIRTIEIVIVVDVGLYPAAKLNVIGPDHSSYQLRAAGVPPAAVVVFPPSVTELKPGFSIWPTGSVGETRCSMKESSDALIELVNRSITHLQRSLRLTVTTQRSRECPGGRRASETPQTIAIPLNSVAGHSKAVSGVRRGRG